MRYLLDTDILSDARRGEERVSRWLEDQNAADLAISALTLAELEIGVRRKERDDPRQGSILRLWLDEAVLPAFASRVLAVDEQAAIEYARIQAQHPAPVMDALIAATAIANRLTLVTRNTKDVELSGARLLNPWLLD